VKFTCDTNVLVDVLRNSIQEPPARLAIRRTVA
jgi:hypothetical protein